MTFAFIRDRAHSFLLKLHDSIKFMPLSYNQPKHTIIPAPQDILFSSDTYLLSEKLSVYTDFGIELLSATFPGVMFLKSDQKKVDWHVKEDKEMRCDEYRIHIEKSGILIQAGGLIGYAYACTTLSQLYSNERELPCVAIHDHPQYSWRGLHFDVARHFFPISFLYELVDVLAFHKLNYLHLHLSDDQGWRFESKKYPRLHEVGGNRRETVIGKQFSAFSKKYKGDGIPHKGYYTQEELRSLDSYAKRKHVTIVPEIDIPGHTSALLAAYPEHAAYMAPQEPMTYWGIFPYVLKPNDSTCEFLCNIFDEIMNVFSSPYIHIGGDEVLLDYYKRDEDIQNLMEKNKITEVNNIEHFILTTIVRHIQSKSREVILWDEAKKTILETKSIAMIWRSIDEAKKMGRTGTKLIWTPASHMYFDYYQYPGQSEPLAIGGYTSLEKVYSFRVPKLCAPVTLGIQANLWTEYIKTEEKVRYMLFPRLYALAEVSWGTNNNFTSFYSRVKSQKTYPKKF